MLTSVVWKSLNPHVVGRFFRVVKLDKLYPYEQVLIPMWWGGFSENNREQNPQYSPSLNPHVVGRFFRAPVEAAYAAR